LFIWASFSCSRRTVLCQDTYVPWYWILIHIWDSSFSIIIPPCPALQEHLFKTNIYLFTVVQVMYSGYVWMPHTTLSLWVVHCVCPWVQEAGSAVARLEDLHRLSKCLGGTQGNGCSSQQATSTQTALVTSWILKNNTETSQSMSLSSHHRRITVQSSVLVLCLTVEEICMTLIYIELHVVLTQL
jgi:hypothetical protein